MVLHLVECFVWQIYPHGSTDTLPFATMGSGSLAAMAIFESKYKEGLTVSNMTRLQYTSPMLGGVINDENKGYYSNSLVHVIRGT